jgi:hypothetical protein
VRAYYAGKAAQTGRIANSPQDVDGKIVREAVRATLGNIVDYNGRGNVFAPWGMGEDEFEDAINAQLTAEAKRRGVMTTTARNLPARPVTLEEQFGSLGLRQVNENTYYVVAGRGVLRGADGGPLTITVGE